MKWSDRAQCGGLIGKAHAGAFLGEAGVDALFVEEQMGIEVDELESAGPAGEGQGDSDAAPRFQHAAQHQLLAGRTSDGDDVQHAAYAAFVDLEDPYAQRPGQSLALCRKFNDIEGIGRAWLNLANTARRAGNFVEAKQFESEAFTIYPMMEEQQANFTAEWERDPAIGERFRAIPYFTNRVAGDDLSDVVARTLARFR